MDNNNATSIPAVTAAVREVRLNLLRVARIDSDQPLAHNFSPGALKRAGVRVYRQRESTRGRGWRETAQEPAGRVYSSDCVFYAI